MRTTHFYPAALLAMSFAGQAVAVNVAPTEVYQAIEHSQTDATVDSDLDKFRGKEVSVHNNEEWFREAQKKLNKELKAAILGVFENAMDPDKIFEDLEEDGLLERFEE